MAKIVPCAIVNGVKVDRKVYAIVTTASYDVWGNKRDGYEVNNTFRGQTEYKVPVSVRLSNLPRFPGAKDEFREFEEAGSLPVERGVISFEIEDKELKKLFGVKCAIDVDGDDREYYINRASDGYPIGEVYVERWEE
jgi:hypothetical protein